MRLYEQQAWALKWRSESRLNAGVDGVDEHLIVGPPYNLNLFRTRSAARAFAQEAYGYIKTRSDLRAEPHGWKFPQVVRVTVRITPVDA